MGRLIASQECQKKKPWGLREHDAEIYRLRIKEGMTLEAIAQKFGTTKQGVSGAVARHLQKLAREAEQKAETPADQGEGSHQSPETADTLKAV